MSPVRSGSWRRCWIFRTATTRSPKRLWRSEPGWGLTGSAPWLPIRYAAAVQEAFAEKCRAIGAEFLKDLEQTGEKGDRPVWEALQRPGEGREHGGAREIGVPGIQGDPVRFPAAGRGRAAAEDVLVNGATEPEGCQAGQQEPAAFRSVRHQFQLRTRLVRGGLLQGHHGEQALVDPGTGQPHRRRRDRYPDRRLHRRDPEL